MEIKILIGDKNNIDFAYPIEMSNSEKLSFFVLLDSLFSVIEKDEEPKFRDWRMGDEDRIQYPRKWEAKEYEFLLKSKSIKEASQRLGRSGMSIIIQAGKWEYEYYHWCNKKGKDINSINNLENIKEFMKECEEIIYKKREEKRAKTREIKEEKKKEKIEEKKRIEKIQELKELKIKKARMEIINEETPEEYNHLCEYIDKLENET